MASLQLPWKSFQTRWQKYHWLSNHFMILNVNWSKSLYDQSNYFEIFLAFKIIKGSIVLAATLDTDKRLLFSLWDPKITWKVTPPLYRYKFTIFELSRGTLFCNSIFALALKCVQVPFFLIFCESHIWLIFFCFFKRKLVFLKIL